MFPIPTISTKTKQKIDIKRQRHSFLYWKYTSMYLRHLFELVLSLKPTPGHGLSFESQSAY